MIYKSRAAGSHRDSTKLYGYRGASPLNCKHPLSRGVAVNRKTSRVLFAFGTATAVVVTCIVLYSLIADLSLLQTSIFLVGSLIVIWAGLFSFFEVRRIAAGRFTSIYLDGSESQMDPDAPRVVNVEPPTDEATPHHENHLGSEGLDQGQLTSQIPDTFPFAVTPMRLRATKNAEEETMPNSTKHYFQELGSGFLNLSMKILKSNRVKPTPHRETRTLQST